MKKSLFIVVALLAVSAILAASAYTSAQVDSPASFTITNTDEALLALSPNPKHNAAFLDNPGEGISQQLVINWSKGYDNKEFGIQKGSIYQWDDLFKVTNNSENKINVTITLEPNENLDTNIYFEAKAKNTGWKVLGRWLNKEGQPLEFSLDPGEYTWVTTRIKTYVNTKPTNGTRDLTMIVEGKVAED